MWFEDLTIMEGGITMRLRITRMMIVSCSLMLFLATGCGNLFPTKIGDILKNPRDYADKEVTISGEVVDSVSFFFVKSFIVKDKTGEITVITNRPVPGKGANVKVTGTVKEAFSLGTQTLLVIVENEKKS